MAHPSPHPLVDHAPTFEGGSRLSRNARYGLWLFGLYVLLYGGFMILTAFRPRVMAARVGGVNLAVLYGFGLIVTALLLSLVYMLVAEEAEPGSGGGGEGTPR